MKLNPECMRSILLLVEDNVDFSHVWTYSSNDIPEQLSCYSHDEIVYHISQCKKSDLLTGVHFYDGGITVIISDLTPAGHEFLANIRNDSIWSKVLSKGVGASVPVLLELAKDFALKHFLG